VKPDTNLDLILIMRRWIGDCRFVIRASAREECVCVVQKRKGERESARARAKKRERVREGGREGKGEGESGRG